VTATGLSPAAQPAGPCPNKILALYNVRHLALLGMGEGGRIWNTIEDRDERIVESVKIWL
jgi:hypothetical protein